MMSSLMTELATVIRQRLLPTLLASALFAVAVPVGAATLPAAPQATAAQAGGERLALVPEAGVQANGSSAAYRDFGTVDPWTTKRLEQTFHLRNAGTDPIAINYIQPSCGCESIVVSNEGGRATYAIAPGAQVAVRVTMDMSRVHTGQVSKLALVYVNGDNRPAFTLEMRAILPALISMVPRLLDFGRLDAGVGRTLTLTVTADKRLLTANPPPKLVCNNPDIQIAPQQEAAPIVAAQQNDRTVTQTYTVALARNTRLGVVGGAIALVPGNTQIAKPLTTPYGIAGTIADALGGETAILSGKIIGKLSAATFPVIFGSLMQGSEVSRRIQLIGATPDILQDLTFSCSLPTMSARLVPQPVTNTNAPQNAVPNAGIAARPTVWLEVTLSAQTPPGGLSGEVVITARDGERLVIPIIGDVIKVDPAAKTQ
jgi:hypothetical protein